MNLTNEQINLMWSDQSEGGKRLRAAKEQGPAAALAELKRQVEAHTDDIKAQEELSEVLKEKFSVLRLKNPKLQMAVKFGCQYIWTNNKVGGAG